MKFGLFTIIKDEQDYLKEWLDYHIDLGIDSIYVFDDVFSTSHKSICGKYKDKVIHKGILELYDQKESEEITRVKKSGKAISGYQITFMYKILNYLKDNTDLDWVFYLDVDEFLTLKNKRTKLSNLFKNYSDYDMVVLQWMNYNASGNITKPKKNVVDAYTTKCQLYIGKRMSPKASSKLCFNLHTWDSNKIKTNHHIPKNGKWCKTNFSTDPLEVVYDKIYIRHYITKSFDEFCNRIYVRGQIIRVKFLNDFFIFNPDISKDDPKVQKIIKKYSDMCRNGEIDLIIQ